EPASEAFQRANPGELGGENARVGILPAVVPDLRQMIDLRSFGGSHAHRRVLGRTWAAQDPASTSAASFASDDRQPASLSAGDRPDGSRSCTARRSVPPSASASVIVIVISPCRAGSDVSNSTASTTSSSGTSLTKRP